MEILVVNKEDTMKDDDIVLAIKGNSTSFQNLIRKNKDSMYRIAKTIIYQEHDIEDAMSETILKAYKGISKLKKPEYFKTWIFRILINECNMIHRKRKKEKLNEQEVEFVYKDENIINEITVHTAIDLLEDNLRTLVILYYFEDCSIKEISKLLEIPEGTIKTRLSKARTKLYKFLKEEH